MPDLGPDRCDGHHEMVDLKLTKKRPASGRGGPDQGVPKPTSLIASGVSQKEMIGRRLSQEEAKRRIARGRVVRKYLRISSPSMEASGSLQTLQCTGRLGDWGCASTRTTL